MGVSRDCPKFLDIISGSGIAADFKFGGYIYRAYPNKSPLKFWRKGSVGISRDCPKFLCIISGTGKATDFKFGAYIYRTYPNKSPLNFVSEKGAWAYTGTAQIFWVSPIISGTGKATYFKFCRNIHRVDRNKKPMKMLGIVAVGVVREFRKFSGHP